MRADCRGRRSVPWPCFGHAGRRGLIVRVTPLLPEHGPGFDVILPPGREKAPATAEESETLADLAPEGDGEDLPPGIG